MYFNKMLLMKESVSSLKGKTTYHCFPTFKLPPSTKIIL